MIRQRSSFLLLLLGVLFGSVLTRLGPEHTPDSSLAEAADDPHDKRAAASQTNDPRAADSGDQTPIGPKWWPSKWGADDQRGAANLMTAEKVLEATRSIKTGKVYQLGRVYERDMPTFPHRTFRLTIPAFRAEPRGDNMQIGRDEFFVGEIGQMALEPSRCRDCVLRAR